MVSRRLLAPCILAGVLLAPGFPGRSPLSAHRAQPAADARGDLDAAFRGMLDDLHLAGIGAGIVKGDALAWTGSYGLAEVATGRRVDPSTLFHMGSVSKTVTAAVLMHLHAQRAFQLDDDVNRHLAFAVRNPGFPDTPITIRMVLTHTSGISDIDAQGGGNRVGSLYGSSDSPMSLEEVTREFLVPGGRYYTEANFSQAAPGTRWEYSNVGYALIGHLVERIGRASFDQSCRASILSPLGMTNSTFRLSDTPLARFAFQYRPDQQDPTRLARIEPFTWPGYPDGSFRTSVNEFSRFLAMLLSQGRHEGRPVVPAATLSEWFAPQALPPLPPARATIAREGYALGWSVHRLNGDAAFMHNGFGGGFATYVYLVPAKQTGGMIFVTGQPAPQLLFPRLERAIEQMVNAAGRL